MDQKKILISASLFSVGGNETHVHTLISLLRDHGVSVVFASRAKDFYKFHRAELDSKSVLSLYTPFGYCSNDNLKNIWATLFWSIYLSSKNKITNMVAIGPGGYHRVIKTMLGKNATSVYWEAGDGLYKTPSHLKMLKVMDKISATSTPIADRVSKFTNRNVSVLPPLTLVNFSPGQEAFVSKKKSDEIRIGFIGRISKQKGVDILLDLWPNLNVGLARLDLFGGGEELPLLKDSVDKSVNNIFFHGPFDRSKDLQQIFSDIDLLVLPSLSEGLPHVLIESIAYGVPFVATNVGGVSDISTGNPDVLLVEPDRVSIVKGIESMVYRIRGGDIFRNRIKKFYDDHFSINVVSRKWLAMLGVND